MARKMPTPVPADPAAGNGVLSRRMFLEGALVAGATGAGVSGASADPLTVQPWMRVPGAGFAGYGQPSRFENKVELDQKVTDVHGLPVLRFSYRYGDNEKKMCADMTTQMQEIYAAAGLEVTKVQSDPLVEGSSVHEVGTARMGADPKTSVLNSWCQSHDVKNLYVVDGAAFVSAACQNPTWTIMALAWRASDHLAEQLKRGDL